MSAAADTFAEFVDGLAAALDDHETTGEDWASRQPTRARPADQGTRATVIKPPARRASTMGAWPR
jgi:hypothetical protein